MQNQVLVGNNILQSEKWEKNCNENMRGCTLGYKTKNV